MVENILGFSQIGIAQYMLVFVHSSLNNQFSIQCSGRASIILSPKVHFAEKSDIADTELFCPNLSKSLNKEQGHR